METPTVLIISDEADFSRRVTARWQMERNVPTFTLLSGELWPRFAVDVFDVAIVGRLRRDLLSVVLEPLHSTGQPVFSVCPEPATAQLVRDRWPRISILRPSEHWLETLVLAAAKAVHRSRAENRARMAELSCATLERQATLRTLHGGDAAQHEQCANVGAGEFRPVVAGAGKPVGANAGADRDDSQHDAAIHEIMQRFSSLEKEMNVVAQQAVQDSCKSYAATPGC